MRGTYHLCLSSHEETMFRTEEDYIRGFNSFALAILDTESRALADGFMATHFHIGVQSDCPREVMRQTRYGYSRYFNAKYHRTGRLGEKCFFIDELDGLRHTVAALVYIMRQGVHHGLSETAFGYEHCSANVIFQKELGKAAPADILQESVRRHHLPDGKRLPSGYRMSSSGLILREDIIDSRYVEELFISPKSFLYNMTRASDENWAREQKEEKPSIDIVNLDMIEKGVPDSPVDEMKRNEKGRMDKSRLTDIELCGIIDRKYVPRYFKESEQQSIYLLAMGKRAAIGNAIYSSIRDRKLTRPSGELVIQANSNQIKRCLALH